MIAVPMNNRMWMPGQAKLQAGMPMERLHPLAKGLQFLWLFNDRDRLKARNIATPGMDATWPSINDAWPLQSGLNIPDVASTQRVVFPSAALNGLTDCTMTICTTPKAKSADVNTNFFVTDMAGTTALAICGNWSSSGTDYVPHCLLFTGGSGYAAGDWGNQWVVGRRELLIGVRSGPNLSFYRNGKLIETVTAPTTALSGNATGRFSDHPGATSLRTVALHHFAMIHNRALHPKEINQLYALTLNW